MINSEYYKIQKLIYVTHDFDSAVEQLLNSDFINTVPYKKLLAQAYFYSFDFAQAEMVFQNLKDIYSTAYCKLLQGMNDEALSLWRKDTNSPAQNWGIFFCELFTKKVTTTPSYLQIRAFLERDLNLFLKIPIVDYVQKIIDISELLAEINPETNKLIAKTFLYNDYPNYAQEYLQRGFEYTQKDAELYYLSGLYYIKNNDTSEAKASLKKALELNNNYIPVQNLLKNM